MRHAADLYSEGIKNTGFLETRNPFTRDTVSPSRKKRVLWNMNRFSDVFIFECRPCAMISKKSNITLLEGQNSVMLLRAWIHQVHQLLKTCRNNNSALYPVSVLFFFDLCIITGTTRREDSCAAGYPYMPSVCHY